MCVRLHTWKNSSLKTEDVERAEKKIEARVDEKICYKCVLFEICSTRLLLERGRKSHLTEGEGKR